jgi:hypothetical protein
VTENTTIFSENFWQHFQNRKSKKRPGAVTLGVAKERSTREKRLADIPKEERRSVDLYYFALRRDVLLNGQHVGWYNYGSGFYPNDLGKEMKLYDENLLKISKFYGLRQRSWNRFFKENKDKISFENEVVLPYRCSTFPDEDGTYRNAPFWDTNRRIPRTANEPLFAPAPIPFNRYEPAELAGATIAQARFELDSKAAEEEFKKEFPEDKFPQLYKHGKTPGKIDVERAK